MNNHLQRLLPYGYLYLVILGVIKETIYYFPLKINILKYSSIMDILISPIADIANFPILIIFFILLVIGLFFFKKYLLKNPEKKFTRKYLKIKEDEQIKSEEIEKRADINVIGFFFVMLICFFLGFGIGGGNKLADKIENGTLNFKKYSQILNFNSGETKDVYIIDHNSMYYFYVEKGKKSIEICPIGSIKSIERK